MKRRPREKESIFANYISDQGFWHSECIKTSYNSTPKRQTTQLKIWAKDLWRHISKGDLQMNKGRWKHTRDIKSSGQDGGAGRNTSLLCTAKRRITTNLKIINNQNFQKIKLHGTLTTKQFIYIYREREREREREKETSIYCSTYYALIDCFLCMPWPEMEPATLVHHDDALTDWAPQPGPHLDYSNNCFLICFSNIPLWRVISTYTIHFQNSQQNCPTTLHIW